MKHATAYGLALLIFLVLDFLWLGLVARGFYVSRIGEMMLDRPKWGVAGVFYALYVIGVVYFAISAGLEAGNWRVAAVNGALFGFFTYLTYNATNLAVLRGYDPAVAIVDTAWGTLMGALVSGVTVAILIPFWRDTHG